MFAREFGVKGNCRELNSMEIVKQVFVWHGIDTGVTVFPSDCNKISKLLNIC